jgi:hypothetical protein
MSAEGAVRHGRFCEVPAGVVSGRRAGDDAVTLIVLCRWLCRAGIRRGGYCPRPNGQWSTNGGNQRC